MQQREDGWKIGHSHLNEKLSFEKPVVHRVLKAKSTCFFSLAGFHEFFRKWSKKPGPKSTNYVIL